MPRLYTAQQPIDDFSQVQADILYSAALAATTDTTLTVPGVAKKYKALIKCEANAVVWFAVNATAAVPAGATFALTTSEIVDVNGKLCRHVKAGDVLHFYTAGTGGIDVSVALYESP